MMTPASAAVELPWNTLLLSPPTMTSGTSDRPSNLAASIANEIFLFFVIEPTERKNWWGIRPSRSMIVKSATVAAKCSALFENTGIDPGDRLKTAPSSRRQNSQTFATLEDPATTH